MLILECPSESEAAGWGEVEGLPEPGGMRKAQPHLFSPENNTLAGPLVRYSGNRSYPLAMPIYLRVLTLSTFFSYLVRREMRF